MATGLLAAIAAGDLGRCGELLDPAAQWWVQGWGEMPAAAFLTSLGETIARSSSRTLTIGHVTAEDNRVAVQAWGEFAFPEGIYANTYHYLFEIADGRIIRGFEYLDTAVAARFFAP